MIRFFNILAVVLFFASPLFSQNTWTRQASAYDENFKQVIFTDSLYGWIAGDSGLIIHTTNGGNNWITQNRNPYDYLIDAFFLNRTYGWNIAWRVSGASMQSVIYSTSNGGQNWSTYVYPDSTVLLNTVYFLNQQTGFIGCTYTSSKTILRTTNGGTNWQPANVDSNFASVFPVKKINFMDANTGFAVGGYLDICGVLWKTTDGGNYWTSHTVSAEPYNSIAFPNPNTVVISGGDYEYGVSITYSTDRGANWSTYFTGYFGIGYSVSFRTGSEGWVSSGFSKMFLKTTDAGVSWNSFSTPESTSVYSVTFPNQKTGWAVGDNGTILKFSGDPIGINNADSEIPDRIRLYPNFPNPFNSSSRIRFEINMPEYVKIIVYDVMGREVSTLVNEKLKGGSYEVNFDGSRLSSGVYFYRLTAGHFTETRKLILMK